MQPTALEKIDTASLQFGIRSITILLGVIPIILTIRGEWPDFFTPVDAGWLRRSAVFLASLVPSLLLASAFHAFTKRARRTVPTPRTAAEEAIVADLSTRAWRQTGYAVFIGAAIGFPISDIADLIAGATR